MTADDPPGTGAAADGRGRERAPSRVGTGVVVAASGGGAALLGGAVGPAAAVGFGAVAAVAFAAGLWLVDRERFRVAALTLAGTLGLVAGAGFATAVALVSLTLLSTVYPAPTTVLVQTRGLRVVSATLVALGATLATLGGAASVGGLLRGETARAYAGLAVRTVVVPLAAALLLAPTLLAGPGASEPTLAALLVAAVRLPFAVAAPLSAPSGGGTHLLTFAWLVAATAASLARALAAAPVPDLLTGRRRELAGTVVRRARSRLRTVATVAGAVVPVALVELAVPQATLAAALGPAYPVLVAVTTSTALRLPLVALLAGSLSVWVAAALAGRTARAGARDVTATLAPFLGGVAVVVVAALLHGAILDPALSAVAESLPGEFGTAFEQQSGRLVDAFGSVVVAFALAAGLVSLTALLAVAVALATDVGAVRDRATGPALAAVGLFVASGFGPGAGVAPPLVLAGLVGSFIVWDAGEYGAGLAREVGRTGSSARPELAHLGGTLSVGLVAAALAWVARGVAAGAVPEATPTLRAAFVAVVAGIALLAAALR